MIKVQRHILFRLGALLFAVGLLSASSHQLAHLVVLSHEDHGVEDVSVPIGEQPVVDAEHLVCPTCELTAAAQGLVGHTASLSSVLPSESVLLEGLDVPTFWDVFATGARGPPST